MADEAAGVLLPGSTPGLVLIDLQQEMLRDRMVHDVDQVLAAANGLLQAFHVRGLPVVLTAWSRTAPPPAPDPSRFAPELRLDGEELLVTRTAFSAFSGTGAIEWLRGRGVDQVILAGVATSIGVESSVRDAADHGLRPVVIADATTDLALDAHQWTLTRVLPIFGAVTSSESLLAALTG
jgi:nicotinamidase-related amidase